MVFNFKNILNNTEEFIKSPVFISGYWTFFLFFVIFRLCNINYKNNFCRLKFFLWSLIQFISLLIIIYITFFFIKLGVVDMINNMISWFKLLIQKRKSKKLSQRIGNFFTRLGLIILLFITGWFLQVLLWWYLLFVYYFVGLSIGYTIIGSNNDCIL